MLVGKKIPLSDATYLHTLEDRLLKKYKQFAHQFFKLDGTAGKEVQVPKEVQALQLVVEKYAAENLELKSRLARVELAVKEPKKMLQELM